MPNLRVLVGRRIRKLRGEKSLTQQELADRTGLSLNMIGYIERGVKFPSPETMERLGKGLGVAPVEFFKFRQMDYLDESRRRALDELEGALREVSPDYIRMVCRIICELKKHGSPEKG